MAIEGGIFIDILTRLNMASVDRVLKDAKTMMKEAGVKSGDSFSSAFGEAIAAGARRDFDPLVAESDAAFRQMQIGMADLARAEAQINDMRVRGYQATTEKMIAAQRELDAAIANSQRLMADASKANAAYRDSFIATPMGERGEPGERRPSTGNNRETAPARMGQLAEEGAVVAGAGYAAEAGARAGEAGGKGAEMSQSFTEHVLAHRTADYLAEGGRAALKIGGLGSVLGLVGMANYGVRSTARVQQNLADLRALQGESPRNINMLSQAAWNQAVETGYNTNDISKLYGSTEKAVNPITGTNYRGQDTVTVTNAALQLARIAGVKPEVALQGLTTGMFNYHVGPAGATGVGNILREGLAGFKGEASDYFEAQHTIDPVAQMAGIGMSEILAMLDQMSQTGQSAQQSGQIGRNLIKVLSRPNSVASAAMQQLNIDPQDLSVNLSQRGIAGTLGIIDQALAANAGPNGTEVLGAMANKPLMEKQQQEVFDKLSPQAQAYVQSDAFQKSLVSGFKARNLILKAGGNINQHDMPLMETYLEQQKKLMGVSDVLRRNQPTVQNLYGAASSLYGSQEAAQAGLMLGGSPEALQAYKDRTSAMAGAQKNPNSFLDSFHEAMNTDIQQWHVFGQALGRLSARLGNDMLPVIKGVTEKLTGFMGWLDKHKDAQKVLIDAALGLAGLYIAQKLKLTKLLGAVGKGVMNWGAQGHGEGARSGTPASVSGSAAAEEIQTAMTEGGTKASAEISEGFIGASEKASSAMAEAITTGGLKAGESMGGAITGAAEKAAATLAEGVNGAAEKMGGSITTAGAKAGEEMGGAITAAGNSVAAEIAAARGGVGPNGEPPIMPIPGGGNGPPANKPGFFSRLKGLGGDISKSLPLLGPGMSEDVRPVSPQDMAKYGLDPNGNPLKRRAHGGMIGYAGGTGSVNQPLFGMPDMGRDSVLGMLPNGEPVGLRGGEGILTPDAVAGLGGPDAIDQINKNPWSNPFKVATTFYGSFAKGVARYSPWGKYLEATSQSLDSLEQSHEDAEKAQRQEAKGYFSGIRAYLKGMYGPDAKYMPGYYNDMFNGQMGNTYRGGGTGRGSPGTMKAIRDAAASMGLSQDQYNAVKWIFSNESGFDPTVNNGERAGAPGHAPPSNTKAYGLGQFLGHMGDKYGAMGAYSGDPTQETQAAIQYMIDRYGSPEGAKAYWQTHGSYATGGTIPTAGGNWHDEGTGVPGYNGHRAYGYPDGATNYVPNLEAWQSLVIDPSSPYWRGGRSPFRPRDDGLSPGNSNYPGQNYFGRWQDYFRDGARDGQWVTPHGIYDHDPGIKNWKEPWSGGQGVYNLPGGGLGGYGPKWKGLGAAHGGVIGYVVGGTIPLDTPAPPGGDGGAGGVFPPYQNPQQRQLPHIPGDTGTKNPKAAQTPPAKGPGYDPLNAYGTQDRKPGPKPGSHHRSSVHGDVPNRDEIPGGTAPNQDRNIMGNPSQQLTSEGKGFGVSGGLLGLAESAINTAVSGAANAAAPGAGAAASQASNMAFQLINRAVGYGGQLVGIGIKGLMETFLPNDSPAADPSRNIFGKIALGIAGAHPSGKNAAGSHAMQLHPKEDLDKGAMAGKQSPGIHVDNIHNHTGDHQETFKAITKAVNFGSDAGSAMGVRN